jgi:hypothetical protein
VHNCKFIELANAYWELFLGKTAANLLFKSALLWKEASHDKINIAHLQINFWGKDKILSFVGFKSRSKS